MIIRNTDGLSAKIYEDLKKKIEEFEYKPGDRISETSLAKTYDVSRTPIKHSLARLENEDLIVVRPQIGTFVSKIDTQHVNEYFTIRKLLEISIIDDVKAEINENFIELLEQNLNQQAKLINDINEDNNIEISKTFWNLDNDFHRTIFKSIDKEFVWDFVISQSSQFNRFRVLSASLNKESLTKKIADHQRIFKYITKVDELNINALYDEHLFSTLDDTIKELSSKYPDYFL